nr:acetyltransferase [Fusobacterium necrophorum]
MNKIAIIGAGGLGREIYELLLDINRESSSWEILGFIDDNDKVEDAYILPASYLGKIDCIDNLSKETQLVIAIANPKIREKIYNQYKDKRKFPIIIHPKATIASSSNIGNGSVICNGAILSINTKFGNCVIINFHSVVAHDAIIGNYVTLHVNVNISGNVRVGSYSTLGSGSSVIQGKKIGENCIIGIGSSVIKNIKDNSIAMGVPAIVY